MQGVGLDNEPLELFIVTGGLRRVEGGKYSGRSCPKKLPHDPLFYCESIIIIEAGVQRKKVVPLHPQIQLHHSLDHFESRRI